jgi:hypothetical protein
VATEEGASGLRIALAPLEKPAPSTTTPADSSKIPRARWLSAAAGGIGVDGSVQCAPPALMAAVKLCSVDLRQRGSLSRCFSIPGGMKAKKTTPASQHPLRDYPDPKRRSKSRT